MYNYVLSNDKIVVTNEVNEVICSANLQKNENDVILRSINVNADIVDYLLFMAKLQKETKTLLEKEGVFVNKVTCGELHEIKKYDDLLKTLDTPIKTPVVNKR